MKMPALLITPTSHLAFRLFALALVALAVGAGALGSAPQAQTKQPASYGAPEGQVQELIVHLGKATVVNLPTEAREVLVSNPGITQAILRTASQTVLLGQAIGQTNVIFFDGAGNRFLTLDVRVEIDVTALQNALVQNFPRANVKASSVMGRVVLTGLVRSSSEAETIGRFAQGYVDAAGGGSGGNLPTEGLTAATGPTTGGAGTTSVVNRLAVTEEDQVLIKVRVAEVSRAVTKSLGINWTGAFRDGGHFGILGSTINGRLNSIIDPRTGTTVPNAGLLPIGTTNTVMEQARFMFDALEQHTLLRLLAEPSLTAVSGQSASMLAGGAYPVVVGSTRNEDNTVTLQYEMRDVGISLNFTPVVLGEGRISLKVATEVSEFTDENKVELDGGEIRGISIRRASTTVELPSGGTIALAGLLSNSSSRGSTGVPGMRNLPVLGALFRSESFISDETELVILATPYVVKHGQESDFRLPTDGFAISSDLDMYLFGRLTSTFGGNPSAAASTPPAAPVGFILE